MLASTDCGLLLNMLLLTPFQIHEFGLIFGLMRHFRVFNFKLTQTQIELQI